MLASSKLNDMKTFLLLLYTVGVISIIFVAHIAISYLVPAPFNYINLITISLALISLRQNSDQAIWYALVLGFLLELFSADYFGVTMAALVVSVMVLSWLLRTVFTNYSWYMIFLTGFLFVVVYQSLQIMFRIGTEIVLRKPVYFTSAVGKEILLEALINTFILTVVYLIASSVSKRHSPRYI